MAEKQNLKEIFGIREKQLRRYYESALRSDAQTGNGLIALLERRLDNAVFRAGFAVSRPAARQMVSHAYVTVNGTPVKIASHLLKVGDVVAIKESKRSKAPFQNFDKKMQNATHAPWIKMNDTFEFVVERLPEAEDDQLGVEIQKIVEYFAR